MDKSAIEAEIRAQSKLMESIAIDQRIVTEIDRHIKEKEQQLNERLLHVRANAIIRHFLPPVKQGLLATQVKDDVWSSLRFAKTWPGMKGTYKEISFDRCSSSKGFRFFYTTGEVTYDFGVCADFGGEDHYVRIVEDNRQTFQVTGASVEIKLEAFQHLQPLLREIADRANNIASKLDEVRRP